MSVSTWCCVLALAAGACATDRARFVPTENVAAIGHGGQPAALYTLRTDASGPTDVRVQVWSRGVARENDQTVARLALEVQNTADQPIEIATARTRLDAFTEDGRRVPTTLVRVEGGSRVASDTSATVSLRFAFHGDVDPDRIATMRLRWALGVEGGDDYVAFTELRRVVARSEVYGPGMYGFYEPTLDDYDPYLEPGYEPTLDDYDPYLEPGRATAVPAERVIVEREQPRIESPF